MGRDAIKSFFYLFIFFVLAIHADKALLEKFIQPTMELVEEAWCGEATTTKLNRGGHRLF